MSDAMKIVSAFTSGLIAAVRFLVPLELGLLLIWALMEVTWSLAFDKQYQLLAFLSGSALVVVVGGMVWRWNQPEKFGLVRADTGSLNAMPLLLLDLSLVLAAVWISDQLGRNFTTPLLSFSQTMIHKLTS